MSPRLRIGLLGLACAGTAAAGCSKDTRLPESCEDIQRDFLDDHDDFPEDKDYTVYADGEKSRPWTVWCENMNRDEPKDYLIVHENDNYSQVSDGEEVVETRFTKVRIDPIRFEIDPWDFAFATTSGAIDLLTDEVTHDDVFAALGLDDGDAETQDVPLGIAYRAMGGASVAHNASARINLSGTSFVLAEEVFEDAFFCIPEVNGGDLSEIELADDLIDVVLTASDADDGVAAFAAAECENYSRSTRIPLQYDGHD